MTKEEFKEQLQDLVSQFPNGDDYDVMETATDISLMYMATQYMTATILLRVSIVNENDMTFLNENTIDPTINKLKELTTAFAETSLEER